MKRISTICVVGALSLALCIFFSGCSATADSETDFQVETSGTSSEESMYIEPQSELENLEDIDSKITDALVDVGYTLEHASAMQEVLNTVGVESIQIENMTGQAEEGLNSVVAYPNDYTERDRRLYFTTEDGILFYVGFGDEDLYDTDQGGYLKNYNDVHVPEKEVTLEIFNQLCVLAEEEVKSCLNYPDSANFDTLNWRVGRSDDKYQIIGSLTAENGLGAEDDVSFSVWFSSADGNFTTDGVELNGVRVK